MESLDHSIGLGMVRGRHIDLNVPRLSQLLEQRRGKLRSSVGCNDRRDAEVLDPSGDESVDD